MRQSNSKRLRGRNPNRRGPNPLTRAFESTGPDVKIRGTAQHIAEKYTQLARDAHSSGDRVAAENYLQHAEHYFRILAAAHLAQQVALGLIEDREPIEEEDFDTVPDRFTFRLPQNASGNLGDSGSTDSDSGSDDADSPGLSENPRDRQSGPRPPDRRSNDRNAAPPPRFDRNRERPRAPQDRPQGERGVGDRGTGDRIAQDRGFNPRMNDRPARPARGEGDPQPDYREPRPDRPQADRERGFNGDRGQGSVRPEPVVPDALPAFLTAPVRALPIEAVLGDPDAFTERGGASGGETRIPRARARRPRRFEPQPGRAETGIEPSSTKAD
jgi:hypothetical protein